MKYVLHNEASRVVRVGLFSSMCVVIGLLLAPVPNVELFTLFIFLGGYLYGMYEGCLIGILSGFVFSTFNPWGSGLAFPLMLVGQIISYGLTGSAGAAAFRLLGSFRASPAQIVVLGLCGGILTLMYSLVLAVFTGFMSGFSLEQIAVLYAAGLAWKIWHIGSNVVLFSFLLPVFIRVAERTTYQGNIL